MDEEYFESLMEAEADFDSELEVLREMEEVSSKKPEFVKSLNFGESSKDSCLKRQISAEPEVPPSKRPKYSRKSFFHRSLPKSTDFQSVSSSGDHLYLTVKPDIVRDPLPNSAYLSTGVSFSELLHEALLIKKSNPNSFPLNSESIGSAKLWQEKYKPSKYVHLLSDDGVNRTLLKWIKCKEGSIEFKDEQGIDYSSFALALLHGPPGLGKTTSAHIIALHSGYNVIEINASDDRSVTALKTKIESAIQMKSLIDSKKNCIILDEIDGCSIQAVNLLLNILKKKANTPIVCICNDLYTPALRGLRKIALVLKFPPVSAGRLVQRLSEILRFEGTLGVESGTLKALCEKSGNDVRTCLSVLQFQKNSKGLLNSSVGLKDTGVSNLSIWESIFKFRGRNKDEKKFITEFLKSVQSAGEYETLVNGIFENYTTFKFKDSRMTNVVKGLEWSIFYDILDRSIKSQQNYSLYPFLPFPVVASHFVFASSSREKIIFPRLFFDLNTERSKALNILESNVSDLSPSIRSFVGSSRILVKDTWPCLLQIFRPKFRTMNTKLFSPTEKEFLQTLVRVMLQYNVRYMQEKVPTGDSFQYVLDPRLDSIIQYPGLPVTDLPYSLKQLVAHEISMEEMRRHEGERVTELPKKISNNPPSLNKKVGFRFVQDKPEDSRPKSIYNEIVKSDIWFKFKEGLNNAVKKTLKTSDFL